jgi:hypothetical protein
MLWFYLLSRRQLKSISRKKSGKLLIDDQEGEGDSHSSSPTLVSKAYWPTALYDI